MNANSKKFIVYVSFEGVLNKYFSPSGLVLGFVGTFLNKSVRY